MKASLAIVVSSLVIAAPTFARVGETRQRVEVRYGKPQRVLHKRDSFRELGYGYHGFMVGVSYVSGISKSEGFARPNLPPLSDAEVQQILALSLAPGTSWKRLPDEGGNPFWIRSDGKVVALLSAHQFLQVQAKGFHQPES